MDGGFRGKRNNGGPTEKRLKERKYKTWGISKQFSTGVFFKTESFSNPKNKTDWIHTCSTITVCHPNTPPHSMGTRCNGLQLSRQCDKYSESVKAAMCEATLEVNFINHEGVSIQFMAEMFADEQHTLLMYFINQYVLVDKLGGMSGTLDRLHCSKEMRFEGCIQIGPKNNNTLPGEFWHENIATRVFNFPDDCQIRGGLGDMCRPFGNTGCKMVTLKARGGVPLIIMMELFHLLHNPRVCANLIGCGDVQVISTTGFPNDEDMVGWLQYCRNPVEWGVDMVELIQP